MAHPQSDPTALRSAWRAAVVLLLAAVLAGVACNRGKPAPAPGPSQQAGGAPPGASALGYCSVTVSGAQAMSFVVPVEDGDFDSDYWRTDAETRELVLAMLKFDEYQFFERDEAYMVEQAMAHDPRINLFFMDCSSDKGGVVFLPGRYSRYADVPFRPGTFEIAPAARITAVTEGAFFASAYIFAGQKRLDVAPVEPGTLTITAFNELQIAGTFSFLAASADGQRVVMKGKFDYRKPKEEI